MRVTVHTLGCKVNQYESRLMEEQLAALPGEGEVILVNTCTVTGLADRKGRKLIRKLRREHPDALIVAVGCQVEAAREQLLAAGADLALGNRDKARIGELVAAFLRGGPVPQGDWLPLAAERIREFPRTRALLKVQDGCSVGCTFCRTFLVRGPLRSKPPTVAREEADELAAAGHREIVIVGINLAQYGLDLPRRPSLAGLLRELLKVQEVRYRLTSLNPEGVTEELIELFAGEPRLCPYFHLPLQSGDDRVLASMGRPYTAAEYREVAQAILSRVPKATLGTDVLVGFPGEDERAFRNTLELLAGLVPLNLHIFRFSPRPGTRAARFPGQVPEGEKTRRAATLAVLGRNWADQAARRFLGQTLKVVPEYEEGGLWWGHAENYLPVGVPADRVEPGKIVSVRIRNVREGRAVGVIVDRQEDK